MSYFICREHRLAYPQWTLFNGHWNIKHPDAVRPSRGDVEMEELPPEYTVRDTKHGGHPKKVRDRVAAHPTPQPAETPKPAAAVAPEAAGERENNAEDVRLTPSAAVTKSPYEVANNPNAVLREILEEFPGMSANVINEVMSWTKWHQQLHPNDVAFLLQRMGEVPKGAAEIIPQKYSLALAHISRSSAQVGPVGLGSGPGGFQSGIFGMGGSSIGVGMLPGQGVLLGQGPEPALLQDNPQVIELRETVGTLQSTVSELMESLRAKEQREAEEKREAQHKQDLKEMQDRSEQMLAQVEENHRLVMERMEKQSLEAIARLEAQIAEGKQKGDDPVVAAMKEQLVDMRSSLDQEREMRHSEQVAALNRRIDEMGKREPESPTELGVLTHTVDNVVGAAKDAGSGIKDLLLGMQKGQSMPPGRRTAAEREALGKEILGQADKAAEYLRAGDELFAKG